MSRDEVWPAPAKLNWFLHVLGRRPDGYHQLQTAFQLLDRGDELRIRVRDDGRIQRSGTVVGVAPAQDLALRAAQLLRTETGARLGAQIEIDKRLPLGGGLGGGSSDAATVLVALNHLWQCGLDVDELAALGLRLGADVPLFVRGHSAWAEGVGERLTPMTLPNRWFAILHPGPEVSTATVFAAPDLTRNTDPIKMSGFCAGMGRNDCEPVVRTLYPDVGRALDWLAGYGSARLTGTGACVFAAFDDENRAREVIEQCPSEWRGFVARGVNESPLQASLRRRQGVAPV